MSGATLTNRLRAGAAAAWAAGLAVIALDFLSLPVLEWRASGAYFCFALAAALTAWAEKREFSTRIFLYRLHDAVIYGPFKYLLLYFLWISLFAPFTPQPVASLVYAANGWMSLFSVAVAAQFIFSERTPRGVFLLPARLALIFRVYGVTVGGLLAVYLSSIFLPSLTPEVFVSCQGNLFLYFTMGLPFLLWDFVKDGRRFLPRSLSLGIMCVGAAALLLVGRKYFQLSLGFSLVGVLGLFLYKTIRPRGVTLRLAVAAALSVGGALLAAFLLRDRLPLAAPLAHVREALETRMHGSVLPAWSALRESKFLGKGVGITDIQGVWGRVLGEAGVIGFVLYAAFFVAIAWELYRVRRSPRVVVSNVAMISLGVFLLFSSHYVENPYGAYVWIWYSLWALFAATPKKKVSP